MAERWPLLVAGAGLLLVVPRHSRLRLAWNPTPSAPIGLYAITAPVRLAAGDLVVAVPPPDAARLAAARDYLPLGVPLLKRIAALPGEPVCAAGGALRGPRNLAVTRLRRDARGRRLPWWQGCSRLRPGSYLLLMPRVPDSFDGRYFGPVARSLIIGKAHPLWLL